MFKNEIKSCIDKKLHTQTTFTYKLLFIHTPFITTSFTKSLQSTKHIQVCQKTNFEGFLTGN